MQFCRLRWSVLVLLAGPVLGGKRGPDRSGTGVPTALDPTLSSAAGTIHQFG